MGKDHHVQRAMAWLASTFVASESTVATVNLQWVGIVRGFVGRSPSDWYSWILATLVVSGLFCIAGLAWITISAGPDADDFLISAATAIGLLIFLLVATGCWVLLSQGTALTILLGVGLAFGDFVLGVLLVGVVLDDLL